MSTCIGLMSISNIDYIYILTVTDIQSKRGTKLSIWKCAHVSKAAEHIKIYEGLRNERGQAEQKDV